MIKMTLELIESTEVGDRPRLGRIMESAKPELDQMRSLLGMH